MSNPNYECPNCNANMIRGDSCPECIHDERESTERCECNSCEAARISLQELPVDPGIKVDPAKLPPHHRVTRITKKMIDEEPIIDYAGKTTKGLWFVSAVSGLWYQDARAAGTIARIVLDGVSYERKSK